MSVEKKKLIAKSFLTRTKSAIFVGSFYLLYTLLLVFSNPNWFGPIASLGQDTLSKIQIILNFLNVLMLVPIIYFVAKEITNLCFARYKGIFIFTAIALFTMTIAASVFLIGTRYKLFFADRKIDNVEPFRYFLLATLVGVLFFTILSTLIWIYMSRHIVYVAKRTRIWYPLLMLMLNVFFVGFVYTTIFHSWTTFIFLIVLSSGTDVLAYLGGSTFGKHKMTPKISPNKTWEGLIFSFVVDLAVFLGMVGLFFISGAEAKDHTLFRLIGCQWTMNDNTVTQPYYWAIFIVLGLAMMVTSVAGDLFFSFCKRRFNIKDFSNLIPGHGGILDRIDSLIFVFSLYFMFTAAIQLIIEFIPGCQTGLSFLWNPSAF